jgi:serine/threonine protein phosphatase PrpC
VRAGALRDGAEGRELADATRAAAIAARRAVEQVPWTARSDLALPSCTFVSAACRAGEAVIGWIGDSRAYWLATGDVRQLTVDDSWATEQVADGLLSAEEAAVDRRAHALTRWVGVDAPDDAPHLITLRPATRGRLILCSDGLWNYASEPQQLATIVAALPSVAAPAAVARRLAALAMERGRRDDITLVVIDLEPARRAAPSAASSPRPTRTSSCRPGPARSTRSSPSPPSAATMAPPLAPPPRSSSSTRPARWSSRRQSSKRRGWLPGRPWTSSATARCSP